MSNDLSEKNIHEFFVRNINEFIMTEHIYPYLYQCQPKDLLNDIKSFVKTTETIEEKYALEYKPVVLTNDIDYFMNYRTIDTGGETTYPIYLKVLRHFFRSGNMKPDNERMYTIYLKMKHGCKTDDEYMNYTRRILGMLTPNQRTLFLENRWHEM